MTKTPFTQELLQQVYEDNGLVSFDLLLERLKGWTIEGIKARFNQWRHRGIIFNIISVVKVFILTFRNTYPKIGKKWLILLVYQEGQTFPKVSTQRQTNPTIYLYMCQSKGRRKGDIRKNKLQHLQHLIQHFLEKV